MQRQQNLTELQCVPCYIMNDPSHFAIFLSYLTQNMPKLLFPVSLLIIY